MANSSQESQGQRPRFYEGQFLSAEDLGAIVGYLRAADARHSLAGHTHGIAIGLHLKERSAPGGANRREVILQPGFAWDGFGRPLAVTNPTRLPENLFAGIPYAPALDEPGASGPAVGRLVPVWLAYSETALGTPQAGFHTCATDEQHARVRESVQFVIGEFAPGPEQRDNILLGTDLIEPQNALTQFDPAAVAIHDASIPHQTFPDEARRRWLVPVGFVRWLARPGALGHFLSGDLVAGDRFADRVRAARRYAGIVTEYIQAADGAIVFHRRGEDPLAGNRFANLLQSGQPTSELLADLVWVEGNLRVGGDAKIAGGKLAFRNAAGLDEGTPLHFTRAGDGLAAAGARELRAVIGPVAQTNNQFIVGSEVAGTPPGIQAHLTVVSSGRVGVNTAVPLAALHVTGDWDGNEDGAMRLSGSNPTLRFSAGPEAGNEQWIVQVAGEGPGNLKFAHRQPGPQWKAALHLAPSMGAFPGSGEPAVGIRSDRPHSPLGVRSFGPWEELMSFEDPAGATRWHINQKALATTPGLNFSETGVADGRLFLKAGGDVGLGTLTPTNKLTVIGNMGIRQNRLYLSGGDGWSSFTYNAHRDATNTSWTFPDPTRRAITLEMDDIGAGGTRFEVFSTGTPNNTTWTSHFCVHGHTDTVTMAYAGGNVGVGTRTPLEKLHVAGRFLRVDGAGNEQAYLGGDGIAADVQLGSLNPGVSRVVLYNPVSSNSMDLTARNINCVDITADDIVADSYGSISDVAHKHDIATIGSPLATLHKLRGVSFKWSTEKRRGEADFGVVAQEVAKVLPHLVRDTGRGLVVSYQSLIPLLLESVKQLAQKVDQLERNAKEPDAPQAAKPAKAPAKPKPPKAAKPPSQTAK